MEIFTTEKRQLNYVNKKYNLNYDFAELYKPNMTDLQNAREQFLRIWPCIDVPKI